MKLDPHRGASEGREKNNRKGQRVSETGGERNGTVRAVDRAVSLLQLISQQGHARVSELAAELGIHKSTASRLLTTLARRGMVEQTPPDGSYRLGPGVAQLAHTAPGEVDLRTASRPVSVRLAEATGETVNLAIHDGEGIISIDQVVGSSAVVIANWVDQRTPTHATAAGKLLLAFMQEPEREQILAGPLEACTSRTITDAGELRAQLQETRERGYAVSLEEQELGLSAVSAPVYTRSGAVAAALTLSGPSVRLQPGTMDELTARTVEAAAEISRLSGYAARA